MFIACKRSADKAAELAIQLHKDQRFNVSQDKAPRTPLRSSNRPPRKPTRAPLTPTRERGNAKNAMRKYTKPKQPQSIIDVSNRTLRRDDMSSLDSIRCPFDQVCSPKSLQTETTLPTDKTGEEELSFKGYFKGRESRIEAISAPNLAELEDFEGLDEELYRREMLRISEARETNQLTTSGW